MSESDFINAAEKGDLITVQKLVDTVKVNSKDSVGKTALYKSASRGSLDVIKFLLARKDVDVNLTDVTKPLINLNHRFTLFFLNLTNIHSHSIFA